MKEIEKISLVDIPENTILFNIVFDSEVRNLLTESEKKEIFTFFLYSIKIFPKDLTKNFIAKLNSFIKHFKESTLKNVFRRNLIAAFEKANKIYQEILWIAVGENASNDISLSYIQNLIDTIYFEFDFISGSEVLGGPVPTYHMQFKMSHFLELGYMNSRFY